MAAQRLPVMAKPVAACGRTESSLAATWRLAAT